MRSLAGSFSSATRERSRPIGGRSKGSKSIRRISTTEWVRHCCREAERFAREELQLAFLLLTVRAGSGPEALYRKVGYQEVGRVPGAMRIGPDDDRDEIIMILPLDSATRTSVL